MKIKNINKVMLTIIPILMIFAINTANANSGTWVYKKTVPITHIVRDAYGNEIEQTTEGDDTITINYSFSVPKSSYKKGETVTATFAATDIDVRCHNDAISTKQKMKVTISDYEIPVLNSGVYQNNAFVLSNSTQPGEYTLNANALPDWDGLNVFDVTYDANGGSNAPSAVSAIGEDTIKIKDKGNMYKEGYAFDKWNTNPDGSGTSYNYDNNYTVKGNTSLYAIWVAYTNTPSLYSYSEDTNTDDLYNMSILQKVNETYEYHYGQVQSDVNTYDGVGIPISDCSNGYCNFTVDTSGIQTYVKVRAKNDITNQTSPWSSSVLINPNDNGNQVFNNIIRFLGIKKANAVMLYVEQPEPSYGGSSGGGSGNNNPPSGGTVDCEGWWCDILDGSSRIASTTIKVIADEEAPNILVK